MISWRLKIGLVLLCVGRFLPHPAHAQFGGGLGQTQTPKPSVTQTPAQMAQDFRAFGFVVSDRRWAYRNVDVVLATDWRGSPLLSQTRGWIMPGPKNAPVRFVAWNGWVYHAKSVGQKADWRADARVLIERAARDYPQTRQSKGFSSPVGPTTWTYEGLTSDDTVSLSFDALTPLKAVMLQLLGEEQLAKQAFLILKTAQKKQRNTRRNTRPTDFSPDPLERFEFVEDWVWPGMNRVDRTIVSGDDVTALETLRVLARGLDTTAKDAPPDSLVRQLLRDWTRRQTDVAPADHNSVAFVIWDLHNVGLVNIGAPAYQWSDDPRFKRAVDYGDQMVEPLLDVLEHDRRLTRGQRSQGNFGGDGNGPKRDYLPVSKIALWALQDILQTDYTDQFWKIEGDLAYNDQRAAPPKSNEETMAEATRQLAPIIRADWQKWRVVSASERPYLILNDDTAGASKWRNAALTLLRPRQSDTHYRQDAEIESPFRFEMLRAKTNPGVSELLARRSNELATAEDRDGQTTQIAVDLARVLHFWDEPAGRSVVLARMHDSATGGMLLQLLAIAPREEGRALFVDRLHMVRGDKDYSGSFLLAPLWENLDDPFWQKVAADMFSNPTSPWSQLLPERPLKAPYQMFQNPLLVVPAWNTLVRHGLADQSVVGKAKWNREQVTLQKEGERDFDTGKPDLTSAATSEGETPLRMCDVVAQALSEQLRRRAGAPPFSIIAPVATRDAQIQTIIAWVALQGGNSTFLKRF